MSRRRRLHRHVVFAVAVSLVGLLTVVGVPLVQVLSVSSYTHAYAEYERIPVVMGANYWLPEDFRGEYFTVINHIRVTVGQPAHYTRTLWIFGNSATFDLYVDDAQSQASQLQALLNTHGYRVRVVNMAVGSYRISAEVARLRDTPIRPGDVVVFFDGGADAKDIIENDADRSATAARFRQYATQARLYSTQHGATFYHFLQPYIDTSYQDIYTQFGGQQIDVPATGFIETMHMNADGDTIVARKLFDALTLI